MDDASPEPEADDSISSSSSPRDTDAPFGEKEEDASPTNDFSPSFAGDVARIWVQEHQKATMLGAFAVGVFVGALLRD